MVKNYETRFFYVLLSDKTWVFDHQSERAKGLIYIINMSTITLFSIYWTTFFFGLFYFDL